MVSVKTPYEEFGIQCGRGWAELYEPLIQRCQREGVEVQQVKSKYGHLRIYVGDNASDELLAAIREATVRSLDVPE